MSSLLFLLVASSLLLQTSFARPTFLYESDPCAMEDGAAGVCRRISECPTAIAQVQNRNGRPTHCSFLGAEEVVCCANSFDSPPRTEPGLRRSEEACRAYRDRDPNQLINHIIGGELALEGEFTHMAALGFVSPGNVLTFRCGGTLISDQYVLTAAHCVSNRNIGLPKMVRLGALDLEDESRNGVDYGVEEVIRHPRYSKRFFYDDVALLKLSRRVLFTRFIFPACLHAKSETPTTEMAVTGWGAIDKSGSVPSRFLLKANLNTAPRDACTKELRSVARSRLPDGVKDNMICAEDKRRISDTCVGDSGGPLQILEDISSSVWSVVGVTSFGSSPCGGKSVYAQVSSYLDWIESVVWA